MGRLLHHHTHRNTTSFKRHIDTDFISYWRDDSADGSRHKKFLPAATGIMQTIMFQQFKTTHPTQTHPNLTITTSSRIRLGNLTFTVPVTVVNQTPLPYELGFDNSTITEGDSEVRRRRWQQHGPCCSKQCHSQSISEYQWYLYYQWQWLLC